jgi:hypothetical protein
MKQIPFDYAQGRLSTPLRSGGQPQGWGAPFLLLFAVSQAYSIFTPVLYRNLTLKWLFPQEKATSHAVVVSICEVKMLY